MNTMSDDDKRVTLDKQELEKLQHQAGTDPLTGVFNRRRGEELIEKMAANEEAGSLLILDLDHFKQVNDTYGHSMGDSILRRFAEILKTFSRTEDVVCRFGGDEFLVFYQGFTDLEALSERCSRLIARTEHAIGEMLDEHVWSEFSVSIGAAIFPKDGRNYAELVGNADKALYKVKGRGGHGFHFHKGTFGTAHNMNSKVQSINMERLHGMLQETGHPKGAFKVDCDEFKKIYRFLSRYCERSGTGAQVVVLTLNMDKDDGTNSMVFEAEHQLGTVIENTLRRGDVTTQYGRNQYLIILMDTDTERGKIAVDRLSKNWETLNGEYSLEYEIQNVTD